LFYPEHVDWNRRMREEWDRRAREDAQRYIYTGDQPGDVQGFEASGEANYKQLVRPFLPILLNGRPAAGCKVVEIGCGTGRMTEWFAREFGQVEAVDISPEMIGIARRRLEAFKNILFHEGSGSDLEPVPAASAEFVFSYIVFQHIPSKEAIAGYVREAARVLRDGGAFKFQVNGDQSPGYRAHERDTWLGETFSEREMAEMLDAAGFSILTSEGAGTQFYVVTARKGPLPESRPYVLAGEPWAEECLLEGFGPPVNGSWRPMEGRARLRLRGCGARLYLGVYFWPGSCRHRLSLAGHSFRVERPGDHYFECPARGREIEIHLDPPPARPPAFRVIGLY